MRSRCALVSTLQNRVLSSRIVNSDQACAGIFQRPSCNGLAVDHSVINTYERNHILPPEKN